MVGKLGPRGPLLGLMIALVAIAIGCVGSRDDRLRRLRGERTDAELKGSLGWTDPEAQSAGRSVLPTDELVEWAEKSRQSRKPAVLPPQKNILVISGGGAYGAYPAGVLYGWTQTGTRPEFDVVTGISTGALIAVFAFLGPCVDGELREAYTMISEDEVYRRHRFPRILFAESLADNAPLERLIRHYATDERIRQVAAEHRRGRRLYVGTSDLDLRRGFFWDLGEIAARDTPEDRELFRRVLLASAAIPGFFPPVRIPVLVDGQWYIERHVDGGVTSSMFFAPPYVPPDQRDTLPPTWLHGSNLYILVAGKMYPDPIHAPARSFPTARNAISTIIYDQTRSDLFKLFLISIFTGMNYHLAVMPRELPAPIESTSFKPEEMQIMFEAGAAWALSGEKWRNSPPGAEPGEGGRFRGGIILTDTNRYSPLGPPGGETAIPPVPPRK